MAKNEQGDMIAFKNQGKTMQSVDIRDGKLTITTQEDMGNGSSVVKWVTVDEELVRTALRAIDDRKEKDEEQPWGKLWMF